jgi:glycosyltransferase involved in cell wall biosynthesis
VGRFSHEKGFDLLLKCMRFVREAVPSAFLTLVGDGPDLAMLKTLQRELGLDSCVRFVGARENPYSYIKYADVLVLPSRCEALPNVVLEAIALGTSVVASNCTEALNEISSCTKLLHVANGTPETLATTIINTLMKKTERVNAGPEPQFEKRFGIRTIIREYERVLRSRTQMVAANSSSHASALA